MIFNARTPWNTSKLKILVKDRLASSQRSTTFFIFVPFSSKRMMSMSGASWGMVPSTKVTVDKITTARDKKAYTFWQKSSLFQLKVFSFFAFQLPGLPRMFPGILSSSRDISSGAHTCCHRNPLPSDVPHIFVGTNSQIQFPGGFQIYSLKMVFKNMSTTGQDIIVICLSTFKLYLYGTEYFLNVNLYLLHFCYSRVVAYCTAWV